MPEAIAALPNVLALDRRAVRRQFEARFTASRMARDYIGLYQRQGAAASMSSGGVDLLGAEAVSLDDLHRAGGRMADKSAKIQ